MVDTDSASTKSTGETKEKKAAPAVLSSAKQVYLAGYKAGLNHVLFDVSTRYQLSQEEIKRIITSLTSVDVEIPDILLPGEGEGKKDDTKIRQPPNPRRPENLTSKSDFDRYAAKSEYDPTDLKFKKGMKTRPAPLLDTRELSPSNLTYKKEDGLSYNSATDSILSPKHVESAKGRSQVLVSTYVLDPHTSRYYPTMIPLEDIMDIHSRQEAGSEITYASREGTTSPIQYVKRRHSEVAVIQSPEKRRCIDDGYPTSPSGELYNSRPVPKIISPPRNYEQYYNEHLPQSTHAQHMLPENFTHGYP